MLKLIIINLLFINAIADGWIAINPLPHCTEFFVEYKLSNSEYRLRYKDKATGEYQLIDRPFKNINDLSLLTNELVNLSYDYCPMTLELTEIDGEVLCHPRDYSAGPFTDEYADFVQDLISRIDRSSNSCDDIAPLIKLQSEISNLDQDQVLKFRRVKNPIKWFTDKNIDKVIDHYYACGGKRGSNQFIQNLILLEAKNACIIPSPPGLLSFDKAAKIAKDIADSYPKMGLIALYRNEENIVKKTVKAFVGQVLEDSTKSLLGDGVNAKEFVSNLKTYQDFDSMPASKVMDYTSYVLTTNAPLEIADKALAPMIYAQTKDLLGQNMSEQQKRKFLEENINPIVNKDYQECIANAKKKSSYDSIQNPVELIKARKKAEAEFCQNNLQSCLKPGCDRKVNYLTDRDDISDMSIVQACMIKGANNVIEPFLTKLLEEQIKGMGDGINIDSKSLNLIAKESSDQIKGCIDKKTKQTTGKNYPEPVTENLEALYHVEIDQFTKILLKCVRETEKSLTKDIAKSYIASMQPVIDLYETGEAEKFHASLIDKGINNFADTVLDQAIDECVEMQSQRTLPTHVSAITCRPMIEMRAGQKLIGDNLSKMANDFKVSSKKTNPVLSEYKSCTDNAIAEANNALYNKQHTTPILNTDDANDYLGKNHNFYHCIKDGVSNIAELLLDSTLEDMDQQIEKVLSNPKMFKQMKPFLRKQVSSCFASFLDPIKSWNQFLAFNENGGTAEMQEVCTERATEYALPKLILDEVDGQIATLNKIKLTDLADEDVLVALADAFTLPVNTKDKNQTEAMLYKAYKKYVKANPGKSVNDFGGEVARIAQVKVVKTVRHDIMNDVIATTRPVYSFDEIDDILTDECINTHLTHHKDNIKYLVEQIKKAPKKATKTDLKKLFVDVLRDGLEVSKRNGRYPLVRATMKNLCQNPEAYFELDKLVQIGIADDFILSQVTNKVYTSFIDGAVDQCQNDLKEHLEIFKQDDFQADIEKLCQKEDINQEQYEKILTGYKKFLTPIHYAKLEFISKRKRDFSALIDQKLSPGLLEKIFFNEPDVLDLIYKNLDKVAASDPATMSEISDMAVRKLFKDLELGSFASDFTEIQLIGAIGVSGFEQGRNIILDRTKEYQPLIKRAANNAFEELWRSQNIKKYLNWNNIDDKRRKELTSSVLNNSILPLIDKRIDIAEKAHRTDHVTQFVTQHLYNYKVFKSEFPNPLNSELDLSSIDKIKRDIYFDSTGEAYKDIEQQTISTTKRWGNKVAEAAEDVALKVALETVVLTYRVNKSVTEWWDGVEESYENYTRRKKEDKKKEDN